MAKTLSIIRYKYKADRDFESVQFEGINCSLGELKRLIVEKSSRSGTHHPKDDYDLIISNATTHEEYKDNSEMIARNASVVVTRRIRGIFESLTPSSNQRLVVSSDDIVNDYLRPAIHQPTHLTTSISNGSSSSVVESKAVPLEILNQSSNIVATSEMSEDERLKEVLKTSRYLPPHGRSNNSQTCHNCKQPGHLRYQCPHLLQSSSTNFIGNGTGSSSLNSEQPSKTENSQSIGSDSTAQSTAHQPSYQHSYHHNNHSYHHHHRHHHGYRHHHHHRGGGGYSRNEPLPKNSTGIPRDGLIQIPRHIFGALRDQTGTSVVPRQMAELIIEKSEKKVDALSQRARQFQEKGVLPPAPPPSMVPKKSTDENTPPNDLLCLLCQKIYSDAVITPCCHNSFCDECIRTALVESEDHECPYCHRQHVAINQINPNLFLRKHVDRWHEEQQHKSSYPCILSTAQPTSTVNHLLSQNFEQDLNSSPTQTTGFINIQNFNDNDNQYDATILSTISQQPMKSIKTAPIVIKVPRRGENQSPQSLVSMMPTDMTFEDGKAPDTDQTIMSQKNVNSELSVRNDSNSEEILNTIIHTNVSKHKKSDSQTSPSQVAPVGTSLPSPSMPTSVVLHRYPTPIHMPPNQQHRHHGIFYPQQMPSSSPTSFYPIQSNYYHPPMHPPYHGHHYPLAGPSMLPAHVLHHYPGYSSSSSGPLPHHQYPMGSPHLQANLSNGSHMTRFETANMSSLHHPNTTFAATSSTSTLIAHHRTATQSISSTIESTHSKDKSYMKQHSLPRSQRSPSHHRSRPRSSSHSSYTSSDSRSSSFSRYNDRHHSSHSQSRRETNTHRRTDNRTKSPNRDHPRQSSRSTADTSKQQQRSFEKHLSSSSSSYQNRQRISPLKNDYSTHYRKPSPRSYRSTREQEKRRSPRPPPTIQQSTQRTIVYIHESSSSKHHSDQSRDRRRTKSPLKHRSHVNDDRTAPSFRKEQQSQSESRFSSLSKTVRSNPKHKTLASVIEPVTEKRSSVPLPSNSVPSVKIALNNPPIDTMEDKGLNKDKKRKKDHHHHHHHKKHRRHDSKSQTKHHSSKNDIKTSIDDPLSTIEAQS